MVLRRYCEALTMFERIPLCTYQDLAYMAACHARLGQGEGARALVAECLLKRPDFSIRRLMAKEPLSLSLIPVAAFRRSKGKRPMAAPGPGAGVHEPASDAANTPAVTRAAMGAAGIGANVIFDGVSGAHLVDQ
jgi:hypothetical protein